MTGGIEIAKWTGSAEEGANGPELLDLDLSGLLLLGRYRLERRLARGGMADVYRAADLQLGRPVAVKIPDSRLAADPTYRERFLREARTVSTLPHPNVVELYDEGEVEGRPFLVMELVEGETLGELLAREGALPLERALAIVQDILAALAYAHSQGIVHRDVKPQNVLLTSEGRAKLADFGIAQAAGAATITRGGDVLGTVHYLAPERLGGQSATPAADIYGVGVVLYQMLVGRLPFEGDVAAVVAQHSHREPTSPRVLRPDLPPWLSQVVLRALAKDPANRYQSAGEMLDDVRRRGAAVHAAPTVGVPASAVATTVLAAQPTAALSTPRTAQGSAPGVAGRLRVPQKVGLLVAALLLALLGSIYAVASSRQGIGSVAAGSALTPVATSAPTSVPATVTPLPSSSPVPAASGSNAGTQGQGAPNQSGGNQSHGGKGKPGKPGKGPKG